ARAHGEKFLVNEVVVSPTERDGEVGLTHPADAEAGRRIEDGRVEATLVHDAEPRLRIVHVAAQLSTERAVPPIFGVVGAAPGPVASFALLSFEVGTELLGRLGDVAVSVDAGHRSPWLSH